MEEKLMKKEKFHEFEKRKNVRIVSTLAFPSVLG